MVQLLDSSEDQELCEKAGQVFKWDSIIGIVDNAVVLMALLVMFGQIVVKKRTREQSCFILLMMLLLTARAIISIVYNSVSLVGVKPNTRTFWYLLQSMVLAYYTQYWLYVSIFYRATVFFDYAFAVDSATLKRLARRRWRIIAFSWSVVLAMAAICIATAQVNYEDQKDGGFNVSYNIFYTVSYTVLYSLVLYLLVRSLQRLRQRLRETQNYSVEINYRFFNVHFFCFTLAIAVDLVATNYNDWTYIIAFSQADQ